MRKKLIFSIACMMTILLANAKTTYYATVIASKVENGQTKFYKTNVATYTVNDGTASKLNAYNKAKVAFETLFNTISTNTEGISKYIYVNESKDLIEKLATKKAKEIPNNATPISITNYVVNND